MRSLLVPRTFVLAAVSVLFCGGCSEDSADPTSYSVSDDNGEFGIRQGIDKSFRMAIGEGFDETKDGVHLTLQCDNATGAVKGTVKNTWNGPVEKITISYKLSNGEKSEPMTIENLEAGGSQPVSLPVTNYEFNRWTVNFEVAGATGTAPIDGGTADGDSSNDASGDGGADGDDKAGDDNKSGDGDAKGGDAGDAQGGGGDGQ
ncbi:MAG: hypothetical protein MPJ50_08185 [Pirellulales bacterium]|nr:hypothetical protein [Pirellulales bacterium]